MRAIGVNVTGLELDFEAAQALAETAARRHADSVMLLAWFDRRRKKVSPDVPECQQKPGWLVYGESHGGDIKVDVNQGDYIFIFSSGP